MRAETERSYQERILQVLVHIEQHLDDPPSLEELARQACFSPFHFHRVFRGMVGEPLGEYVRRLRLERGAQQLREGSRRVGEIARDAGYESHEGFTRAFEARFGMAPSAFRGASQPRLVQGTALSLDVRLERISPLTLCYTRHIGPFEAVGRTWMMLTMWAGPRGLIRPETRFLTVWLDDPEITEPAKLRGDVGITVDAQVAPEGAIGTGQIDGGEWAVATHRGPYAGLGEVYAQLCGPWAAAAGRELRDYPAFEAYLNNPQRTPPEELLTEVWIPLKVAARP